MRPLKEKELRLALVCYGGVSLAIYEHGITKEFLKLVRASKAYHQGDGSTDRQSDAYTFRSTAGDSPDYSTEDVYFDVLKAIGPELDLRVIVDVIAGSSAGGINGVVLARALAHNLSLSPLTSVWLQEADMTRLLAPEAKARAWSKWYFRPIVPAVLWGLGHEGFMPQAPDKEMRRTLSVFLRSRWFKPPLDGRRMTNLLLDGLSAMEGAGMDGGSLLPIDQRLDLLVTCTDYHGSERSIFIHDPPSVREREHRHMFRFSFERPQTGAAPNDFDLDNVPSLAFAARATASYPGAFPPVQLSEMDSVLAERGQTWPRRDRLLDINFRHYRECGMSPEDALLFDGSTLNNKPIFAAIEAIRTHRAFREVDRRLVYIDPRPMVDEAFTVRAPGFFDILRGALSDLPRHEPIYQELAEVDEFNAKVRRARAAIAAARPHVTALVDKATLGRLHRKVRPQDLRRWRLTEGNLLARTGLVYNTWIRLMLLEAIDFIADLVSDVCGHPRGSPPARWVKDVITAWSDRAGIYADSYVMPWGVSKEADLPPFATFIVNYGVKYRRRRLTFVIQAINSLYVRIGEPQFAGVSSGALDALKQEVYRCLEDLRAYDDVGILSAELAKDICALFDHPRGAEPPSAEAPAAQDFAAQQRGAIDGILERIGRECDLVRLNERVDAVLASPAVSQLGPNAQREVLTAYLGFNFWDVILLPMVGSLSLDVGTLQEILVDRISPEDAVTLALPAGSPVLLGGSIGGFGGFFSRAVRENDYLWGRLHAIDRLLDILASTVAPHAEGKPIDMKSFKKRAFEIVLQKEAPRLKAVPNLIAQLQEAVARL